MNSVLKWPGAKNRLAGSIIDILPPHKIYLEPFFGSGAVFLNKAPCQTEIINDLDTDIVNFFKCVRDYPAELAALVEFTPYSRTEYRLSDDRENISDLEKARRFLVRCNMARAGMQYYSSSWRHAGPVLGSTCKQRVVAAWNKLPEEIIQISNRFKDAEIENRKATELIEKYNVPDCLVYIDAPYILSTRRQRYYNEEMETEEEHEELLKVVLKHTGSVAISHYDHELYNDMLHDWQRYEFATQAEQGKKRIEVVWVNRKDNQLSLFG